MEMSIGKRVGWLFVMLVACGAAAVFVIQGMFASYRDLADTVNQSGRLRMLSQRIVFSAYRAVEMRPGAQNQLRVLLEEFESRLDTVERHAQARGSAWADTARALQALANDWRIYRQAARALLTSLHDPEKARIALEYLDDRAEGVLLSAEGAVAQIIAQQAREQQVLRLLVIFALLAGLGIAGMVYVFIRTRVVGPTLQMAEMARRIAAGDFAARVDYQAGDEIGTLAATLNHTADTTQQLIEDYALNQAQLQRVAHYDSLTELPNRTLLLDRIEQAIAAAKRYGRCMAVLRIDLDHFKFINDSLGHDAGDRLLRQVAARLPRCVRENDTVARIGGDEFVLLLTDAAAEEGVTLLAERVLATMAQPYELGGREAFVGSSIGASLFPRDGEDAETLLRHADIAMHRAKDGGRNAFQFYTAEMQARFTERVSLEAELRHALQRDEFVLHYQPQVCLATGRIVGAEALVRWNHPERGLLAPVHFIPLAEETGLIVPLGEWVMFEACSRISALRAAGIRGTTVAVNLSARQFRQKEMVRKVAEVLRTHDLASLDLELELTESMVMQDPQQAIATLHELKELGVRLSMDDFGTGYSSLSYLRRFPIDVLKIDRSFIDDVATNADDAAIATAIIMLARSLKLHVIAEGVENPAQLAFLRRQGCDMVQGYLFSRPLPGDALQAMLQQPPDWQQHLKTDADEMSLA